MQNEKRLSTFLLSLIFMTTANAQHDSLILKNRDIIVGEIKSMDKGVLTIETNYSKKDFTVEWSGIKEIYSKNIFLVTLTNGTRINGYLQSIDSGKKVLITPQTGEKAEASPDEIVYLKGVKSDFWSRMNANVDIGLGFTKANNLRQVNINTAASYLADKWQLSGYYNMIASSQDSISTTQRIDASVSFNYFLPKDWFLASSLNFLSNTEQALKLRTTGKLGGGKYFIHTNKTYWAGVGGLSLNNETSTNKTPKRTSLEGYLGSELNMFDIGDLNLFSSVYVYPSFTESGRIRTDFNLDTKYDLPLDFYIRMGLTFNYDNQPAAIGKETDYVLSFTFGWKL